MNKGTEKQPILVIMGPTASGKSSLSLELTKYIRSEIISADSMQIYKEMDIGTAKPSKREQDLVPHHMLDILDISKKLDVYFYKEKAQEAINSIIKKNKLPILVGGSGLYIKSILYGLDPLPSDSKLQENLFQTYKGEYGLKKLQEIMKEKDSNAYHLYKYNHRKLLRALEVFYLTGRSITEQQNEWYNNNLNYNTFAFKIKRNRRNLYDRIKNRTEQMLDSGWIEETKHLINNRNLLASPTAKQAIGYLHINKYLKGELNFLDMKTKIVSDTKKFARKQENWFKNKHPEAETIETQNNEKENLMEKVLNELKEDIVFFNYFY